MRLCPEFFYVLFYGIFRYQNFSVFPSDKKCVHDLLQVIISGTRCSIVSNGILSRIVHRSTGSHQIYPLQNPGKRSSGLSCQALRVHRTAIACAGQKVWHEKHIMQILLFSGKTPSPFTLTKTPMEHMSTHLKWFWQCWHLSHRSGSI